MDVLAQLRPTTDANGAYDRLMLWCPACDHLHVVNVSGTGRPVWGWNGDLVNVTVEPSILVTAGTPDARTTCHSFLRDGVWQFLGDCTHAHAGESMPMVPLHGWVVEGD